MSRYLVVFILGLLVGVGAAAMLRSASSPSLRSSASGRVTPENDSASVYPGILALHHEDSVATIAGDPRLLSELWDGAAVRIVPGASPTVTRASIFHEDSAFLAAHRTRRILRYAPHYSALSVSGNMAVEWGYFDATVVQSAGAKPDSGTGNVLRVMRRQPNGSWKFTHVILNSRR